MFSLISRRRSWSRFITMALRSRIFGCRTCLRLKASNCRTSVTARSAASSIRRISVRNSGRSRQRCWAISTYPLIMVRRLLKSCATPPANLRFDLGSDVMPLGVQPNFGDVANGRGLLDEHAVFSFGFDARALRGYLLGDVVAHTNRAAIGQGSNGRFRLDQCSVTVMHGMRPEPFAMLFQGFANFRN